MKRGRFSPATNEGEGVAGFLGAEDADESAFDALLADELLGPVLLAERAGAIKVDAAGLVGQALSVLDETVGEVRGEHLDEVAAPHPENVIDEALQFPRGRHGQMALEDDAIKTVQGADDEAGELGQEPPYCRHGILPRKVVVDTNHSGG